MIEKFRRLINILGRGIIIITFLILCVFLLINIVAIWGDSSSGDILEFDAWYGAIAIALWSLIYITRKGLWSLREKHYKASLDATPPSNNSMQPSPQLGLD